MFECAVVLLGSADMSWRAVRHATQDDNFCTRLAAVCVPALTQTVTATIADKLEVFFITVIVEAAVVVVKVVKTIDGTLKTLMCKKNIIVLHHRVTMKVF